MTTPISYSNQTLFWSVYKNALSRLRGVGILYLLLSLLVFPGTYFLEITSPRAISHYDLFLYGTPAIFTTVQAIVYFPMVLVFLILMGNTLNGYLQNKKAVDVYHALPIRRESMLLANLSATITALVVPMAVCYFLVFLGNLGMGTMAVSSLEILLHFLRSTCLLMGVAALHVLCCVCTSSQAAATLFTLALNGIIPALLVYKEVVLSAFLRTYQTSELLLLRSLYTSPVVLLFMSYLEDTPSNLPITIGSFHTASYVWAILAVVIAVIACVFYGRRKSERAESRDTSGWLYHVILVAFSMGCGSLLSFITLSFWGGVSNNLVLLTIASGLYGALTYFILSASLSRSLRMKKGNLPALILSALLPLTFLSFATSGWFGYDQYLPPLEEISSVSIFYQGRFQEVSKARITDTDYYYTRNAKDIVLTQPENIALARELHEISIAEQHYGNSDRIVYTLKNGKTVSRRYSVNTLSHSPRYQEISSQLDCSPEVLNQTTPLMLEDSSAISAIRLNSTTTGKTASLDLSPEEIALVYAAMKTDLQNTTPQQLTQATGMPVAVLKIDYQRTVEAKTRNHDPQLGKFVIDTEYIAPYVNVQFDLLPHCTETLSTLKQLGVPPEMLSSTIPQGTQLLLWNNGWSMATPSIQNIYGATLLIDDLQQVAEFTSLMRIVNYRPTGDWCNAVLLPPDWKNQIERIDSDSSPSGGYSETITEEGEMSSRSTKEALVASDEDRDALSRYLQLSEQRAYMIPLEELPPEVADILSQY